jgi:lipid-A-disaccharide synthase
MRKALLPWVGLPNVLAGEFIVPELLQDHATAENLSQALANWLEHKGARARLEARYREIHERLRQGNDERVADALEPYLRGSESRGATPFPAAREPAAVRGR